MPKATQDLNGRWEFREYPPSVRRMRDLDGDNWQPARVPGSIFTSLIEAGKIRQNRLWRDPEQFAWVSDKPWVFRRKFDLAEDLSPCERLILIFDGLDTVARIWLNDKLIGKPENMFTRHRFDVTSLLKPRDNTLLVKFEPAVAHGRRLMQRYGRIDTTRLSDNCRVYVRKAQYQFGWDFCPPLPGCGIYRGVRINGITGAAISDIHVRTVDCNEQYADVKIEVKLRASRSDRYVCRLDIAGPNEQSEHRLVFAAGEDFHSALVRIDRPELWWPAGYGSQVLYRLNAGLYHHDQCIDHVRRDFGIRTAHLVLARDRMDNASGAPEASAFAFQINGRTIAVRGANWIPVSMFPGSAQASQYEQLLELARRANCNMLRVWAGGYYEDDAFYNTCDRLGILVWQDFMFACAYYPDRRWFLDHVKAEAEHVVRRLRNHPSVVLWCGNSQIDQLHYTGRLGSGKKFYGRTIYHRLLPQVVRQWTPGTPYIPTTPLGKRQDFRRQRTLNAHQWRVWSGHEPVRDYLGPHEDVPAFVTEFGMQSPATNRTIRLFAPSHTARPSDRTVEKHNYQADGNSRLYRYVGDLFGPASELESFAYLSQLTQARAMQVYVERLRGNRRNSGVLFRQFNDCWPATTWSALDVLGQPKALWFYARRFFADVLVAVDREPAEDHAGFSDLVKAAGLTVVNDGATPLTGRLNCRLVDLSGRILDHVEFPIAAGPFGSKVSFKLPKAFVLPERPEETALSLSLQCENRVLADNSFFYLPDKYVTWPAPGINVDCRRISDSQWKVVLEAQTIARDVALGSPSGDLLDCSDNYVDIIPPAATEVTVRSEPQMTDLAAALRILSVNALLACDRSNTDQ